jgi:regulator of protease activity HflC (stomatin/prohibitin superfamily)
MFGLIFGVIILIAGLVAMKFVPNRFKGLTATVGVVLATVLVIIACISYVPTGYTGIVTTFGKVHDEVFDAGINFHAPWDNVIKMDNREQRTTFQLAAFSKDIQQVDVQGSVNFNIDKVTAQNLYRDVGTGYAEILIGPRIQEDVKIIIAKYTAENLIDNRQAMSDAIYDLLKAELAPKGINVISLAIENIDFTDAFEAAVEAKQVATQEKQRVQTQQEQETMTAKQKAERARIAAQADADVAKINADAEAYAVKVQAEAQAEANKQINASLTTELIEYNKINNWDGKLPMFTGGDTIPLINLSNAE